MILQDSLRNDFHTLHLSKLVFQVENTVCVQHLRTAKYAVELKEVLRAKKGGIEDDLFSMVIINFEHYISDTAPDGPILASILTLYCTEIT